MPSTEIIKIPIELSQPDAVAFANALKGPLKNALQTTFNQAIAGVNVEPFKPTLKQTEEFLIGGKLYRASVEAGLRRSPRHIQALQKAYEDALSRGEPGTKPDFENMFTYLTSLKEIQQEAALPFTRDKDRLKILKNSLKGLELGEQARDIQAYMRLHGDFNGELRKRLKKIYKTMGGEEFRSLKARLKNLPDDATRVSELQQYLAAGGKSAFDPNMKEAIKSMIANLQNKMQSQQQKAKNDAFRNWQKRVKAIEDPEKALEMVQRRMALGPSMFDDDMKRMANVLRNRIETRQRGQRAERGKRFSNMMMVGAGAGLGLLGPAGFPLLNVGFAAMSGGVPGAIISGIATSLGELIRLAQSIRDSSLQTARGMGFVGSSFKLMEARQQAVEAFTSVGSQAVMVARERRLRKYGIEDLGIGSLLSRSWEAASTGFELNFKKGFTSPAEFLKRIVNPLGGPMEAISVANEAAGNRLHIAQQARRAFMLENMRGMPGIENDPYEVWKRMQNAAMDPLRQEQLKYYREALKKFDEMIATMKGEKPKDRSNW